MYSSENVNTAGKYQESSDISGIKTSNNLFRFFSQILKMITLCLSILSPENVQKAPATFKKVHLIWMKIKLKLLLHQGIVSTRCVAVQMHLELGGCHLIMRPKGECG